jgi:hypothetical protein
MYGGCALGEILFGFLAVVRKFRKSAKTWIKSMSQAERQEEGQEPEQKTGHKAIVNLDHSIGTTAPSRKLFQRTCKW